MHAAVMVNILLRMSVVVHHAVYLLYSSFRSTQSFVLIHCLFYEASTSR